MSVIGQFSIVFGICLVSEWLSSLLPIDFPGSVIAMLIMFILLCSKVLKPDNVIVPTNVLIGNMSIIFLPASVGIIEHYHLMKGILVPFLIICFISTVITFGVTALTVRATTYLMKKGGRA